jgi:hypothetical protein
VVDYAKFNIKSGGEEKEEIIPRTGVNTVAPVNKKSGKQKVFFESRILYITSNYINEQ